jgi:hypothetical protein
MKKFLIASFFIIFSYASSLQGMQFFDTLKDSFSSEQITQVWQSCIKKFDEAHLAIKIPVFLVGTCCFIETYIGIRSWLFGKKTATKAEVAPIRADVINLNQLSHAVNARLKDQDERIVANALSIGELQALNPDNRKINDLHAELLVVETFMDEELEGESLKKAIKRINEKFRKNDEFVKQTRLLLLTVVKSIDTRDDHSHNINKKLDSLMDAFNQVEISPRKRHSLELASPRDFFKEKEQEKESRNKGKEKITKEKKHKKKRKKGSFRDALSRPQTGTPRVGGYVNLDDPTTDEENGSPRPPLPTILEDTLSAQAAAHARLTGNLRIIQPLAADENA